MKTLTGDESAISAAFDAIGESSFDNRYHYRMLTEEPNHWRGSVTINIPNELYDRLVIAMITRKLES